MSASRGKNQCLQGNLSSVRDKDILYSANTILLARRCRLLTSHGCSPGTSMIPPPSDGIEYTKSTQRPCGSARALHGISLHVHVYACFKYSPRAGFLLASQRMASILCPWKYLLGFLDDLESGLRFHVNGDHGRNNHAGAVKCSRGLRRTRACAPMLLAPTLRPHEDADQMKPSSMDVKQHSLYSTLEHSVLAGKTDTYRSLCRTIQIRQPSDFSSRAPFMFHALCRTITHNCHRGPQPQLPDIVPRTFQN